MKLITFWVLGFWILLPVVDFLGFSPSVIAAAAVISASGKRVDFPAGGDWTPESFYERVDRVRIN